MKKQEDLSFTQSVVGLIKTFFSLVTDIFDLAATEIRLAKKNLIRVVWLFIVVVFLLISVWIFLLAALAAWLVSLHLSWELALLAVAGLVAVALIIVLIMFLRAGYSLTFPATRRQLGLSEVRHAKSVHRKTKKEHS